MTCCMIPFIQNSRKQKIIMTKSKQISSCQELGLEWRVDREYGFTSEGHKGAFGDDVNVLIVAVVVVIWVYIC